MANKVLYCGRLLWVLVKRRDTEEGNMGWCCEDWKGTCVGFILWKQDVIDIEINDRFNILDSFS